MTYVNNAIHQLIHQLETRPLGSTAPSGPTAPSGSTETGKAESTNFTSAIQKKYDPATTQAGLERNHPNIIFSRLSKYGA